VLLPSSPRLPADEPTRAAPRNSRRALLAPPAVLALSLLLTAATVTFFFVTARARDTARFEALVQLTQGRLEGLLQGDIALLRGVAGLFAASESVTLQEFRVYVERLNLERYEQGVQGIGFSRRLAAGEREDWEARLWQEGFTAFHVWPDYPREEYHTISYLEPQNARNQAAMGYDMFTEPTRRAAMERAWLLAEPSLSGKVTLKQEIDEHKQAGFLLYIPVYRGGHVPATEAQRREALVGFVYMPFRADDLLAGFLPEDLHALLALRIYDGEQVRPEQLLHDSAAVPGQRSEAPVLTDTLRIEVAGRPWTLVFSSQPDFERSLLAPWVPVAGGVGVLFSLMLSALFSVQVGARRRAEASEAERARLLAREQTARAEAEAQRAWLQDLFMQAPALILISGGPRHFIEFANTMCRQIMDHRELEGRYLPEAVPDLAPGILATFSEVYHTGQPHSGTEVALPIAYTHGFVEERYWNIVWQPRRSPEGTVDGVLVFAFEVTAQVRARKEMEQTVRLRDEFLSVASHELKTPLTPLSLKLQALAREAQAQPESPFVLRVRGHAEVGLKQMRRLSDLVGDLLDVSRITSGQMRLHWEPVDFAAVTREVVARLEPEATKAESPLRVQAPQALAGSSDRMRLEQVVENLLTNAVKYGAGKPIHVRLEEQSGRVVLVVQDQGIGIAPEHQARIFGRFERAVSERNYGGLGLGLYITRTIVEALGGSIRVHSQPGQGALFTVELPRESARG
jgi:signal transduction histidine kinase/CHASE1-domain containing sensor protein